MFYVSSICDLYTASSSYMQFALVVIMYVFVPLFSFDSQLLRPAFDWTPLSFRVRAGPGSDLGLETGYPNRIFVALR
jgi:hypothetical protein